VVNLLLTLSSLLAAAQDTTTLELSIEGPNCPDCKQDIERGLRRVPGFASAAAAVDVERKTGTATLQLAATAAVNRSAIQNALRQFTVTSVRLSLRGELLAAGGTTLEFRARGSGQSLSVVRGSDKEEAAAFDALRKEGAGKYVLSAELIPTPGGGQALRLKSYQKSDK
jgi:copper chaperone CopZ